ncbi:acyltransferase family protein [Hahella sp. NBU794]|uniref:acyltransferase family protein n=1 Tax=Hahella sp. NBU794 TaxID=3422590 RepID=UPI003D701BA1
MENQAKNNIDWIDTAKGVCILLVVLHHVIITSYALPGVELSSTAVKFEHFHHLVSTYLAPLRMPLFFMISGFLVHRAVTQYRWRDVAQKRIYNLVFLFVLWGELQWLGVTIVNWVGGSEKQLTEVTNALYSSNPAEFIALTLTGSSSLWYLYALPWYFAICKLMSNRWPLAMLVLLTGHFIGQNFVHDWPTKSIIANGVFYGLGCFYGRHLFSLLSRISLRSIGLLAVFGLAALSLKLLHWEHFLFTSLLLVSISVIGFAFTQSIADFKMLRWMGKNTLQIYVLHRIFIEIADVWLAPALIKAGVFDSSAAVTSWYALYPTLATLGVTALSLFVWSLTNRGPGAFLYTAPDFHVRAARLSALVLKR